MNRNTLSNKVDGLYKAIRDNQEKHKAACVDLEAVTAASIEKPNVKEYTAAKNAVEFYDGILARLFDDSRKARLELWDFDLTAAKDERLKMGEAMGEAKARLNQAIKDKADFLRAQGMSAVINESAERLATLEILIVDYRTQLANAERNRNIAKRNVAELEARFNDEAIDLNVAKIPMKEHVY